jgi:hypothetical protein
MRILKVLSSLIVEKRSVISKFSLFLTQPKCTWQFLDNDPVRTMQLTNYVAAALQEAERACGGIHIFNQYISKTDPTLLKQLQNELQGE